MWTTRNVSTFVQSIACEQKPALAQRQRGWRRRYRHLIPAWNRRNGSLGEPRVLLSLAKIFARGERIGNFFDAVWYIPPDEIVVPNHRDQRQNELTGAAHEAKYGR
jgi:hypothetical protein